MIDEKINMNTGEVIVEQGSYNPYIYIVSEGIVQVRVAVYNEELDDIVDYWFESLKIGSSFNVYSCMDSTAYLIRESMYKKRLSIVNCIASSENCSIETINFNDILELSKSIKELRVRIK
tara:strand:+ start:111 stop:470 length:360 start_codon:yes stop_codon:yes gene_type:complete